MHVHIHHRVVLRRVLLALALSIVTASGMMPVSTAARARQRCFSETNFCVADPILAYWERNGGLPVFGYPIGPLQTKTIEGTWTGPVQWFQRDRLEDHRNDGQGVLAGRLGAQWLEARGTPWQTFSGSVAVTSAPCTPDDCRFFPETNHTLRSPFREYWERNGGLERFGFPLTEVLREVVEGRIYEVQYFERRRMEYHEENRGTPYEVLLGLLGQLLNGGDGSPWFFSPAPAEVPSAPVAHYDGAIERFEHGFLVWIREPDHFLLFVDGGQYWIASAPYTFKGPSIKDPSVPPEGRFRPSSGFGTVWRGEFGNFGPAPLSVAPRQLLGWAVELERPYATEFACHGGARYADQRCYLRGPEGEIIWYGPAGWGQL